MTKIIYSLLFFGLSTISFSQTKGYYPFNDSLNRWLFLSLEGEQLGNQYFDSVVPFRLGPNTVEYFNKTNPTTKEDIRYNMAKVKVNDKWGVINEEGKFVLPAIYDTVSIEFKRYLTPYYVVGNQDALGEMKLGFCSPYGKLVLPIKFHSLVVIEPNGISAVQTQDSKAGFFHLWSLKGKLLLPFSCYTIEKLEDENYNDWNKGFLAIKKSSNLNDWALFSLKDEVNTTPFIYSRSALISSFNLFSMKHPSTRTSACLMTDKRYFTIFSDESKYQFYSSSGELLFDSKNHPYVLEKSNTGYYFVGDSLVAKTLSNSPSVHKIYKAPNYLYLFVNGRNLVYNRSENVFLDTSKYQFKSSYHHFISSGTSDKQSEYLSVIFNKIDQNHYLMDSLGRFQIDTVSYDYKMYSETKKKQTIQRKLKDSFEYSHLIKINYDQEKGQMYVVRSKNRKHYGVVSENLEIILPFSFNEIYWNKTYKRFLTINERGMEIYNLKGKKQRFKDVKMDIPKHPYRSFHPISNNLFVVREGKKRTKIYNLATKKFIYNGRNIPLKKDSLLFTWYENSPIPLKSVNGAAYIQVFHPKKGWVLYSSEGKKVFLPEKHIIYDMFEIHDKKETIGVYYRTTYEQTGDYSLEPPKKYHLFNGVRLDISDTNRFMDINYEPISKQYMMSDRKTVSLFDESGKKLFTSKGYRPMQNTPNYIIETNDGVNLMDSNYRLILQEFYQSIDDRYSYFIALKNEKYHIIKNETNYPVSKVYEKLNIIRAKPITAENSDGTLDLMDQYGNIVLENIEQYTDFNRYCIAVKDGREYWLTFNAEVYAEKKQ